MLVLLPFQSCSCSNTSPCHVAIETGLHGSLCGMLKLMCRNRRDIASAQRQTDATHFRKRRDAHTRARSSPLMPRLVRRGDYCA
uniref:Uncharacterized protein n=1 Tax=Burkholderia cenocepacia TaxID=95486 RepID=A0A071MGC5_9BURK